MGMQGVTSRKAIQIDMLRHKFTRPHFPQIDHEMVDGWGSKILTPILHMI